MERLTSLSQLEIPKSAIIHSVPPTIVGIRERSISRVAPNTSVDSCHDTFTFTLNPNIPSELDLRSCNLFFKLKPTKDGSAYGATDQISTVQALGVLFWNNVKINIAGEEVLKDYKFDNHIQYIRIMTGKDIMLGEGLFM